MNTKILLMALAIIAIVINDRAMARLNETKEQCVKRYGEAVYWPVPTFPVLQVRYHYCYLNIDVGFTNGVASIIRYSKRVDVTDPELRLILDAEGGIANWREVGKQLFQEGVEWRRSDGVTAILCRNFVLLKGGNKGETPVVQAADFHSRFWKQGYPLL